MKKLCHSKRREGQPCKICLIRIYQVDRNMNSLIRIYQVERKMTMNSSQWMSVVFFHPPDLHILISKSLLGEIVEKLTRCFHGNL